MPLLEITAVSSAEGYLSEQRRADAESFCMNASIGKLNDREVDRQAQTEFTTATRYYLRPDPRDAQEQFAAFASFCGRIA